MGRARREASSRARVPWSSLAPFENAVDEPVVRYVMTVETRSGRTFVFVPDDQNPAVSHVLAEGTVKRLG